MFFFISENSLFIISLQLEKKNKLNLINNIKIAPNLSEQVRI